jgi:hypothetical protein
MAGLGLDVGKRDCMASVVVVVVDNRRMAVVADIAGNLAAAVDTAIVHKTAVDSDLQSEKQRNESQNFNSHNRQCDN